jgi:hypothetical protein
MKACGKMATKFYNILNFGTRMGEWSALDPVRLISRERKRHKIGEEPEWGPSVFFQHPESEEALSLAEIESRFHGNPARSLLGTWTELSRL